MHCMHQSVGWQHVNAGGWVGVRASVECHGEHVQVGMRAYVHGCGRVCARVCVCVCVRACMRACVCVCMRACMKPVQICVTFDE